MTLRQLSLPPRTVLRSTLVLIALGVLVALMIPAGLQWDFSNFYDAGHKVRTGQIEDLYNAGVEIDGSPPVGDMSFLGTPLSAAFYVPLSWMPPPIALVVFKLQNVLAYLAGLLLLFRFLGRFDRSDPPGFAALFTFLVLIYQPFWTAFRVGGQTTPTVFLLLVVALLAHVGNRPFYGAMAFALAVTIKPALAPALMLLLLFSGWRYFVWSAAWGTGLLALSVGSMGWEIHAEFLRWVAVEAGRYTPWIYNSALVGPLDNLRALCEPGGPWGAGIDRALGNVMLLIRLAVLAWFVWLAFAARRGGLRGPAGRFDLFCLALVADLMSAPIVWEHYHGFLFLPLAYFAATRRQFPGRAVGGLWVIFALSVTQNLVLTQAVSRLVTIDRGPELFLAGLVKALPLLLLLVWVWRYRGDWLATYEGEAWREIDQRTSARTRRPTDLSAT